MNECAWNNLETAPALRQAIAWIVALLVPVALVLTAVRLLMTPAFVQIEYSTPGFPADPFGFTSTRPPLLVEDRRGLFD